MVHCYCPGASVGPSLHPHPHHPPHPPCVYHILAIHTTLGQYWHRIRSRLIGNGSFVRSSMDVVQTNTLFDPIDPIRVPVRKRRVDAAALSHS